MKNNSTWILLCLACMMTLSCSDKKNTADESEKGVSTVLPDTKNEVAVQILKKRDFHHELVSNGKINARGKADLRFETGEVIAHIYVKNGDRVQKGQKLADLDKFRLEQKLSQSEDALLKAELELKDVLIGQGYSPDDFSKVPAETMKIAKVKSGYEQSKSQYELAKREMEHATLIAPFDGVVANLFSKPYNPANTSEAFCTIIDSKGMEADFTVLENELAFIRMGDKVVITPYAGGDAFEGSVSEINPLVDANGMVKVKAVTDNQQRILVDGMNVSILIKRQIDHKIIIPKSAVLPRQGKKVVFVYQKGKAMWRYVTTGYENSTEVSVEEGISPGDTVIYDNNLGLSHMNTVVIEN